MGHFVHYCLYKNEPQHKKTEHVDLMDLCRHIHGSHNNSAAASDIFVCVHQQRGHEQEL